MTPTSLNSFYMTQIIEVTILAVVACVIAYEWRREMRHQHHLGYRDALRSMDARLASALERGRDEGYQECLDDLNHETPAVQIVEAHMTKLGPPLELPEWDNPAKVPPSVVAALEPPALAAAPKPPGELTVQQEALTAAMVAEMDAIRTRAFEALK